MQKQSVPPKGLQKQFTQPDGWVWDYMVNEDGAILRHGLLAEHRNPIANIIIRGGLSEMTEKYFETIRDLDELGYNCYSMESRGEGGSERYLSDPSKRHSLGFGRDKRDLLHYIARYVPDNAPRVILAHSMGALPALLAIRDEPDAFQKAVLTAPLMGFEDPRAKGFEWALALMPPIRSLRESYIPGNGPWRPQNAPDRTQHPPQTYSSHPTRMYLHENWMEANPNLRIGGPTKGLIAHASKAIMTLRCPGAIESIKTPIRVFSAGLEQRVSNTAIFNMAARLKTAPPLIHLTDAKHDILLETDDIRSFVLKKINSFSRLR
ncbi:MAG TPA: alpha/beta hydrolase [Micavibrio sp.]